MYFILLLSITVYIFMRLCWGHSDKRHIERMLCSEIIDDDYKSFSYERPTFVNAD